MQALAILLAVAVTSADSTNSSPAPAGSLRASPDVRLPTKANWDSFPVRDRRSPSPTLGIQKRAPVNSEHAIRQVDFESEGLSPDPAAPPPSSAFSPASSNGLGASRFPAASAGASSRETPNQLMPVPRSESAAADPYAVPDLRTPNTRPSSGNTDRQPPAQRARDAFDLPNQLPDSRRDGQTTRPPASGSPARDPITQLTPAVQRTPLDAFSTQMVNDPNAPRRNPTLVPGEFDTSPIAPSRANLRGAADQLRTPPSDPFPGTDPRGLAAPPIADREPAPAAETSTRTPPPNYGNPSPLYGTPPPNYGNPPPNYGNLDSRIPPAAVTPRQPVAAVSPGPPTQAPPANYGPPAVATVAAVPNAPAAGGYPPRPEAYPSPSAVPVNPRVQYEERPWAPFFATLLALFASGGLNLYLGWIAWDTYNRYQELVSDMRHETRQRERQRDRDRVREKVVTTGAADYSF